MSSKNEIIKKGKEAYLSSRSPRKGIQLLLQTYNSPSYRALVDDGYKLLKKHFPKSRVTLPDFEAEMRSARLASFIGLGQGALQRGHRRIARSIYEEVGRMAKELDYPWDSY